MHIITTSFQFVYRGNNEREVEHDDRKIEYDEPAVQGIKLKDLR